MLSYYVTDKNDLTQTVLMTAISNGNCARDSARTCSASSTSR